MTAAKEQYRALVVDDNEINLIVAKELLECCGLAADTADSGESALAMAKENLYDVVFMDHLMPGMDGMETTTRLRALGLKNVPVIALTADETGEMKNFFLANGFSDYMSKPLDMEILQAVLQKWLLRAELLFDGAERENVPFDDILTRIEAECGLAVTQSLSLLRGNQAAYRSLLEIFIKKTERSALELNGFFAGEKWDDLRIAVHGYKSACHNIGALDLEEKARQIELALLDNKISFAQTAFPCFLEKITLMTQKLAAYLTPVAPCAVSAAPGDKDALAAILAKVVEFLDMLESEEALREMETARQFSYGAVEDELLGKIQSAIEGFDYDGAASYIDRLRRAGDDGG